MKKLLSIVLVLAMVLGLSVTAFAEDLLTEVNFTLSEYVDENTAMTITVSTEETANFSKTKFDGFLCVDGDSTYIRSYNEGNGFTQAGFDDWENYIEETVETPELDGSTMFAMFELTTVNKHMIKEGNTVVKNGGNVVPSLSDYIGFFDVDESHYKDEATYEAAYEAYISKYVSFTSCPTDTFWYFNETELHVFIKLFGSAPKSGTTEITATKAEPELAYTIVIPTATTLTEEKHANVQLGGDNGVAGITVTTASAKTNVYYTVDLTNGTLTNGTNTITTSYAYAQGGDYSELTGETKVTVYEGGTVKDSTIQVTADEASWTAAPAGTYNASVVFNFGTEEVTPVTAADAFTTDAMYKLKLNLDIGLGGNRLYSFTYKKTIDGFEIVEILESDINKTEEYKDNFSSTAEESSIIFNLGELLTFTLNTSTNTYGFTGDLAESANFVSFSVKPAGATEFTEVTLTPAR